MDELALIDQHVKENKPEQFIKNCLCCAEVKFDEVCKKGYYHLAKWMIDHGANIHAGNDYALRWASDNGHPETVKLLLEAGADVHADNDCALRWASEEGHTEIVKLLNHWIKKHG